MKKEGESLLFRWRIVATIWTLSIVFLSVWPFSYTPRMEGSDKVAHFLMYAVTTLIYRAAGMGVLRAGVLSVGLGAGMELVQAGIPWRSFSVGDLLANAAGAAFSSLLVVVRVCLPRRGASGPGKMSKEP